MNERNIICIDLKSFFASCECLERNLDPLKTNLVVADQERTEKTICLAVSPSLKSYGIPGRARLFEVIQKVKEINAFRKAKAPRKEFTGSSYDDIALKKNNHTVSMIGDGVNDVLSLKESDCAIAMNDGADAARNVSEIILLDSDFNSIPNIVKEGRRTINNVERSATLFLSKTIYASLLALLFLFINYLFNYIFRLLIL